MSFILDALKKSEEQREQLPARRKPQKRILTFSSAGSRQWSGWLLVTLPLLLFSAWVLLDSPDAQDVLREETLKLQATPAAPAIEQVNSSEETAAHAAAAPPPSTQDPVTPVEPAPVPRPLGDSSSGGNNPGKPLADSAAVASDEEQSGQGSAGRDSAISAQLKPAVDSNTLSKSTGAAYPWYAELSPELRSRIPKLAMSMHFFISEPQRRLVRINGMLLHEGELVEENLRVIEIRAGGDVVLDYFGKRFILKR